MTKLLENNNYFNHREHLNKIHTSELFGSFRVIFSYPNGYDGVVSKCSDVKGWVVSVAINGIFVDDTPVTDGFIICSTEEAVERILNKIKNLRRRVA